LACRLANLGYSVAVIDQAPLPPMEHPAFDGRAYAIAAGSRPLLEAAGIWEALPDRPSPILDIRVTDGRVGRPASRLRLHFDHRALGEVGEPFGWMVEARSLRRALNETLHRGDGVKVFAPDRAVVTRHADRVDVALASGARLRSQLIVAAEGRNSPLRDGAGIPLTRLPYNQTGIVCAITHEYPHHGVALEHFLPAGPFAVLPMAPSADAVTGGAEHVSAIVWTEQRARADVILALDDTRFGREIQRRLGDHLGTVKPVGRRWSYPLSAMLVHRYTDTRLVVVGDAAHGIHPIAGQGLNLGFRDVIALASVLPLAPDDLGSVEVLARYQRLRRPDNLAMLAMTDGLDRLFSSDNPMLRLARDLGIAGVDRAGPVKRFFMRRAMGR
jgi:2-octaprenyl-6-methoxyphenol hydroxylase